MNCLIITNDKSNFAWLKMQLEMIGLSGTYCSATDVTTSEMGSLLNQLKFGAAFLFQNGDDDEGFLDTINQLRLSDSELPIIAVRNNVQFLDIPACRAGADIVIKSTDLTADSLIAFIRQAIEWAKCRHQTALSPGVLNEYPLP